ncbi:MAG: 3-methyl-2-oxobutanoate hydroxymethyltransferase [Anaerovorax sp.]
MAKITTLKLQGMKDKGEKISMTTAYDYPTACMVEKAGIEIILVGDSLMMTVLGDDSTIACTMDQMIHHIKPVVLGAPTPLIVGDMPFGSYQISIEQALKMQQG